MRVETTIQITIEAPGSAPCGMSLGACALVGSASHCDVRLLPDQAAPEQLRLALVAGRVHAEPLAESPPLSLAGARFTGGELPEGAELLLGGLRLRVALCEAQLQRAQPAALAQRVRRAAIALLACGAVVAIGRASHPDAEPLAMPSAPPLWPEQPAPRCPETGAEAALEAARELLAKAAAKHERAPFAPDAGLSAVPLYEHAGACLLLIGDSEQAARVHARAAALRERMARDYHLQQVRLLRALTTEDWETAERQALRLTAYLGQRASDYATWLDRLRRKLELEAREKEAT